MRSIFNRCDADSNTTSERAERRDFLASCATEGEAERGSKQRRCNYYHILHRINNKQK